jgi:hypothetical protein
MAGALGVGVICGGATLLVVHEHHATEKGTYAREVATRNRQNAEERATIERYHAVFIGEIAKASKTASAEALAEARTQLAQQQQFENNATRASQVTLLDSMEESIENHQNNLAASDAFIQPVSSVSCIPTSTITVTTQTAEFNCIAIWADGDGNSGTGYTATLDYETGEAQWQEN